MLRDTVRDFCSSELMPGIVEANRRGRFDRSVYEGMARLGILGANLRGYGCAGASSVAYGLAAMEIERVDSALLSVRVQRAELARDVPDSRLRKRGAEAQVSAEIGERGAGRVFALTEPDAGSDPASMKCRAVQEGASGVCPPACL